jgi:hypothetical protein
MTSLSSKEKDSAEAPPFWFLIYFESGYGNNILHRATIMIFSVDPGLAGPQAVSSVGRRNALHHRDKNKGHIRRCSLYGSVFIRF